jgi:hypothetical protein
MLALRREDHFEQRRAFCHGAGKKPLSVSLKLGQVLFGPMPR